MTTCLHCGKTRRPGSAGRGLCRDCHRDKAIRALYPRLPGGGDYAAACRKAQAEEEAEAAADARARATERSEGDPHYRCLYCGEWRCDGPLRRCESCDEEYRLAAVGMPAWCGE